MALQSSLSSFTYDVFLNFRGVDARYGFANNLYQALRNRGINTFFDDDKLQSGEEIAPSLVQAIQGSRIAIPIFSEDYCSSSFCLDELVHIVLWAKEKGQLILPVFYDVDPSHVRHQRGSYGKALAKHEARFANDNFNLERLHKWKMALNYAANLSGLHFKIGHEYEHGFIGKIVSDVSRKINHAPLHVADYPVGLESRVLKVKSLLKSDYDSVGVNAVAIYGIGGIGKTTLARAVYNSIADHFNGLCFLENVRENSIKHGLVHLQEKLLSDVLGEKDIRIGSPSQGIPIIKERFREKKILLILDDVDRLEQLKAIAGGPYWFGDGSRILITTRDKRLLWRHEIKTTYKVDGLNKEEALELFRWNAFRDGEIDPCYMDILNRAVTYASGLPLALQVIGSNLFGMRIREWESALDQYERIPNKEIQKILQLSYDALEEEEQRVFLDIACCFKGYPLAEVEDVLCAHHGNNIKYHIQVLVEKSLIKINEKRFDRRVTLHDLIEDMGKEIVRQESPNAGKRSRLWSPKDIVRVLEDNMGSREIEMIYLNFPLPEESLPLSEEASVEWDGEAFVKMKNLKTLIIRNGHFSKGPEHLPTSLRVLEWWSYPSQDLPRDFHPKKLAICRLPYNSFASPKKHNAFSRKTFKNMRDLNVDHSQYLKRISDVSGLPNLEKISFQSCENLITIHDSVGLLDKLKILNAYGCTRLKSFPPLKLPFLEELQLSCCLSLECFPEILEKMEKMTKLSLYQTAIKEFPVSFQNLTRLQQLELNLGGVFQLPRSIVMMQELVVINAWNWEGRLSPNQDEGEDEVRLMVSSSVERLCLKKCKLSDEFLSIGLTWFTGVKELDLSMSNFRIIPDCIKECLFLWKLVLNDSTDLQKIRGIPPNLKYLSAENCKSLTFQSRSMLMNQPERHEDGNTMFYFPSTGTIPNWFEHRMKGSTSFWVRNDFPSIALCLCKKLNPWQLASAVIWDKSSLFMNVNGEKIFLGPLRMNVEYFSMESDHMYIFDPRMEQFKVLLKDGWNHVEVLGKCGINSHVEIGIHVFRRKSNMKDIQFTNPYAERESDSAKDLKKFEGPKPEGEVWRGRMEAGSSSIMPDENSQQEKEEVISQQGDDPVNQEQLSNCCSCIIL